MTLQEVLNEDDVLQECKAQNKKLVDLWVRFVRQHIIRKSHSCAQSWVWSTDVLIWWLSDILLLSQEHKRNLLGWHSQLWLCRSGTPTLWHLVLSYCPQYSSLNIRETVCSQKLNPPGPSDSEILGITLVYKFLCFFAILTAELILFVYLQFRMNTT